ncbi:MAG: hypothetical protein QW382_07070 [Nitrososphaerota archaeon]
METEESREELKVEEAEEEKLEASSTREVSIYKIGEHEVEEVEGEGVYTTLRCVKCGLTLPLNEVDKLASNPCMREPIDAGSREASREVCEFCGREAIGRYYTGGASPNQMISIPMCSDCLSKHEQLYMKNRPAMVYGRRLVRGRYPAIEEEKTAWVNEISTWFISRNGSWTCPRCREEFKRLGDAVKHFIETHPELTSTKEKIYVHGIGEVYKTWQGLFCNICGLMLPSKDALREHYRIHHGGV